MKSHSSPWSHVDMLTVTMIKCIVQLERDTGASAIVKEYGKFQKVVEDDHDIQLEPTPYPDEKLPIYRCRFSWNIIKIIQKFKHFLPSKKV